MNLSTVCNFHDFHTVPFCLIVDHIATCDMSLSVRVKPAQFWSAFGHVLYGRCPVPVTAGFGRTRGVPRKSWHVDTVLVWWSDLALVESHEKPRQDATGTVVVRLR